MKTESQLREFLSEVYRELQSGRGSVALGLICALQNNAYDQGHKDGIEEERMNDRIAEELTDL